MKRAKEPLSKTHRRTITADSNAEKFIGRRRELDHLQSVLDGVTEGRGHICMLVGEPGIGKTRTAEEVELLAGRMSFFALKGCCIEERGVPPLWPWLQLLRSCVEMLGSKAVRRLLGNHYPFLRVLLQFATEHPEPPGQELATLDGAQFALYTGIASFFRSLSKRAPLLVILEDLQWADNESLRVLEFVTREISQEQMCLIGTYRNRDSYENRLDESIGALHRGGSLTRYHVT